MGLRIIGQAGEGSTFPARDEVSGVVGELVTKPLLTSKFMIYICRLEGIHSPSQVVTLIPSHTCRTNMDQGLIVLTHVLWLEEHICIQLLVMGPVQLCEC